MPRHRFQWGRTVEHLREYRHISTVLIRYGFDDFVSLLRRKLPIPTLRVRRADDGRTRPQRLRLVLEELGPTYIKLGQLLSTRPDIIPVAYAEELERLQDQVPPVKFELIKAELESQLDGRLESFFIQFNPEPLAAGSIAQVHRAITREGAPVAVKIRRPGIVQKIRVECEVLETLARLLQSNLDPEATIDPVQMVREFSQAVNREVDLANELRNMQRFAHNFAGDPTIHVPTVFPDYSATGVLTMEFIDGIKCNDVEALDRAGMDRRLIADRGAQFVLRQIFEFGFLHTDPHPGNLFVLSGNVVAPLDFGQVAHLTDLDRSLLADFVLALVEQDSSKLVRAFQRYEMTSDSTDVRQLGMDMQEMLETYHDLPMRDIPFGPMMGQTFDLLRRHHVHPPPAFTMMLKSMMTIESVATALDHEFSLAEKLKPYAQRLRLKQMDPAKLIGRTRTSLRELIDMAMRLPRDLSAIVSKVKRGQVQMHVHHEHLESLIYTLDKASNRISFAFIIAGLVVSSSLLIGQAREGKDIIVLGLVRLETLAVLGYVIAAMMGFWLVASIIRGRHV